MVRERQAYGEGGEAGEDDWSVEGDRHQGTVRALCLGELVVVRALESVGDGPLFCRCVLFTFAQYNMFQ